MAELFSHEYFMEMALKEARKAFDLGEIPIGAVVVSNNKVIGRIGSGSIIYSCGKAKHTGSTGVS